MRKPWYRKSNGHWYVEIHGTQHRLSEEPLTYTRKPKNPPPEVVRAWDKLRQKGQPRDMKVDTLIELFLETVENPDNVRTYRYFLNSFKDHVGERKALDLIPLHLTEWLKEHPDWSPGTVRTAVSKVHAALNWAVRQGILDKNPISSTPGYKREGYYERRRGTVPVDVAERLEAAARPAFARFLRGLRETGARPAELRRALIEKLDCEGGTLTVPNKTKKQTRKAERTLILSRGTVEFLRDVIGGRTSGYIFLTSRRKPWTLANLKEYWSRTKKGCKWRAAVEVPEGVSLYTYRSTFISSAINDHNINPRIVAELVGHSNLEMIMQHYYNADPDALRRAMEKVTGGKLAPDNAKGE